MFEDLRELEEKRIQFLREQLDTVGFEQDWKLRQKFHMDVTLPETAEEAIQRIKDGTFTLEPRREHDRYHAWHRRIDWRDPAKPADLEGYEAAHEKLKTALTDVLRTIKILPQTDGLAALKAFEAMEF